MAQTAGTIPKFDTSPPTLINSVIVESGGNIGIGTALPGSLLDVKGTLRLSGSSSGYVGFSTQAAAGGTTYTLPSADGSKGDVLTTDGSAALSWSKKPFYDVTDHGIVGNDSNASANTTALTTLISSLPVEGAVLFFPKGIFRFQANMAFSGQAITICGAGIGASVIRFMSDGGSNVNNGITFEITDPTKHKLKICDLSVTTDVVGNTQPAIKITTTQTMDADQGNQIEISHIDITPNDYHLASPGAFSGGYFNTGIQIAGQSNIHRGIGNVQLRNVVFYGVPIKRGTIGLRLTGRTFGTYVLECQFINWDYAVKGEDTPETIFFSKSSAGAVNYGVLIQGAGTHHIENSDFACAIRGVYLEDANGSTVDHNVVYDYPNPINVASNSAANPTVVTTSTPHNLQTGDTFVLNVARSSESTPSLVGTHTVTVLSATTFSVPVNCSVGGGSGDGYRTGGWIGIEFEGSAGNVKSDRVTNNFVFPIYNTITATGLNYYGIYYVGTDSTLSGNNTCENTVGIYLSGAAARNNVIGNVSDTNTTALTDSGTSNNVLVSDGNYPGLVIPRLTSTQEGLLTAVNGMLIYNTTTNKFRGYENGAWTNLI